MSADEMCGDYPAPCNCDDPETHDGAVTAADRPSVTDDTRAEAAAALRSTVDLDPQSDFDRGYAHGWHAAAEWAAGRAETTTATPPGLTVSEDGSVLNWQGVNYVPQRAETTTATDEDMFEQAWEVIVRVRDAHPRTVDDAPTEDIVDALIDAGLLATARTRPTRYEVARAIRLSRTNGLCKPGVRCDLCDCAQEYEDDLALRDADAALAAEEALHAAGWFARADIDPATLRGILHDLADAGLLATTRTRPAREELSTLILSFLKPPKHSGGSWTLNPDDAADAVLALYADQPTEAEAGAQALEAAAHILGMMELTGMHLTDMDISGWLRERAARLRSGAQ